jgi:hypothetical protein
MNEKVSAVRKLAARADTIALMHLFPTLFPALISV